MSSTARQATAQGTRPNPRSQTTNRYKESDRRCLRRLASGVITLMLLLAGCATSPDARFYLLESLPPEQPAASLSSPLVLEIGPILFPDYLDRPQILLRSGPGRVQLAEFDRWSGNLETDFERVLIQDLNLRLPGLQLSRPGLRPANATPIQVAIEVVDFSGSPDGRARLSTRWQLIGTASQQGVSQQQQTHYLCSADQAESLSQRQLWAQRLGAPNPATRSTAAENASPPIAVSNSPTGTEPPAQSSTGLGPQPGSASGVAYLEIVAAMSQCVAAFADDLADELTGDLADDLSDLQANRPIDGAAVR